ncbi:RrF2 family transcriptional regulator [Fusobacterium ulcerans]|uniref:RrF2 family transcriptional regulator n=1 Tax=Fusobacterium ulcerans TaxID=861 RepID=UPI002E79034C|nr:Rrf2 family transcriptional regulator [Fusobacterium ulcerans]MEE0137997.1 Rrf2 family transcriptional regulator [Fusobacterium ulcerans]
MRLNQENVYGIKLVEYLANLEGEKTTSARNMSEETGISIMFALKILRILKNEGIISSQQGITGGYKLKKEEVSIYEIVKALKGDLYITNDLKEKKEPEGEIEMELKKIQEDIIGRMKNLKIRKKN